jgi:hypothetical protein
VNALFRHPVVAFRDLDEDAAEVETAKFDLAYISLDGNIGCLVWRGSSHGDDGHHQSSFGGEAANWTSAVLTERTSFKIMLKTRSQGILNQHLRQHHEVRH